MDILNSGVLNSRRHQMSAIASSIIITDHLMQV